MKNYIGLIVTFIINTLFYLTGGFFAAMEVSSLFGVAMSVLALIPFLAYVCFTVNKQ